MNKDSRKKQALVSQIASIGLLLLLHLTAFAQTAESTSSSPSLLRIGIAGVHYQVKDRLIAPLRWDGPGFGLRVSYMAISPALEHEIDLLLPLSFLTDRYGHKGYAFGVSLGYSRLSLINPSVLGGNLSLGPQVRWNADCQFYADWDDSHLYWLNVYALGAALQWTKYYNSDHRVSMRVQIPLLALISRPAEYQYFDQAPLQRPAYYVEALHQNLRWTSVNEYVAFGLKADYVRQVGSGTTLGATWSFQYRSCKFPKTVSCISHTLTFDYVIIM